MITVFANMKKILLVLALAATLEACKKDVLTVNPPVQQVPAFPAKVGVHWSYNAVVDTAANGIYNVSGNISQQLYATPTLAGNSAIAIQNQTVFQNSPQLNATDTTFYFIQSNGDVSLYIRTLGDLFGGPFSSVQFTNASDVAWRNYFIYSAGGNVPYTVIAGTFAMTFGTLSLSVVLNVTGKIIGQETITVNGTSYQTTHVQLTIANTKITYPSLPIPITLATIVEDFWLANNVGIVQRYSSAAGIAGTSASVPAVKATLVSVSGN
jgi:hypothetical protein